MKIDKWDLRLALIIIAITRIWAWSYSYYRNFYNYRRNIIGLKMATEALKLKR